MTLIDKGRVNAKLYNILKNKIYGHNPAYLMKAIKGEKEIKNTKEIQILDGVAMDSLKELENEIVKFVKDRDWDQFHSPENLAKSISIEANELLECFQWTSEITDQKHDRHK